MEPGHPVFVFMITAIFPFSISFRKVISNLKLIHDVEFKNHYALRTSIFELPKDILHLRPDPFKRTKSLSQISKLVRHRISFQEQNHENILKEYTSKMSSIPSNIGPIMQASNYS